MTENAVIELSGVTHRYDEIPVLGGVDLAVYPGEIMAILGTSGTGKSTLLRAVAGFVTPQGGRIQIGDRTVFSDGQMRVPPEKRRLGMMFQDYALFPHMSVLDNVAFGLHGRSDAFERARDLLGWVGLEGLESRQPGTLSGGQQQRVALVRALAPEPVALMLDEPFANLDGPMRAAVGDEVRRLLKRESTCALLVTHDRREALGLADRVAVLSMTSAGATVAQVGTPESIYAEPNSEDVARLTGPAIFVKGTGRGERVDTPYGQLSLARDRHGEITVVIRPEQLRFVPGDGPWQVVSVHFVGPGYRLALKGPQPDLSMVVQTAPPDMGTQGSLTVSGTVIGF